MLDGQLQTTVGYVEPNLPDIVPAFDNAQGSGEGKIGSAHNLYQCARILVQVSYRMDVGGDIVRKLAKGLDVELLCRYR